MYITVLANTDNIVCVHGEKKKSKKIYLCVFSHKMPQSTESNVFDGSIKSAAQY